MNRKSIKAIVAAILLLALALGGGAQAQKLVDVDLWLLAAVSEAGPPPDDWVGYQIIKDELGINLKITIEPSSFTDQDTKVAMAAASNTLPDLFGVNREMLIKIAKQGLSARRRTTPISCETSSCRSTRRCTAFPTRAPWTGSRAW